MNLIRSILDAFVCCVKRTIITILMEKSRIFFQSITEMFKFFHDFIMIQRLDLEIMQSTRVLIKLNQVQHVQCFFFDYFIEIPIEMQSIDKN